MKILFYCLICSLTFISSFSHPQENVINFSPYRSGKYMSLNALLLQIPLKQSYDKLSPFEKSLFRKNFRRLSDTTEPSFPRHGLLRLYDPIYYAQNKLNTQGLLYVVAVVDLQGQVQKVEVFATPSKAMTKVIVGILFKTRFKPALCSNSPCPSRFPILAKFTAR